MAITEDSSAPAAVHSATTSGTTGSFSPPANSLLVVMVAVDGASSGATTVSLSDSGSHTWTLGKRQNTNVNSAPVVGGSAEVWLCQLTTAPGSITVTASWATNGSAGGNVVTKVLLGAATTQTGAATGGAGGGNIAPTCTLTPTVVGSHVYGAILDFATNATLTANANSTIIDQFLDSSNGDTWGTYKGAADTTTLTSTTFGATNANSAFNIAALEILPASTAVSQGSVSQSFHPGKGTSNFGRFFQTQKNAFRFENDVATTEALGTGTANDANVIIAPAPTSATGTGTANNANTIVAPAPSSATGTGTANSPTTAIVVNPTNAGGTGTANNPGATVAPAPSAASATGTANDANVSIVVNGGNAAGTGTAFDATVNTGGAAIVGSAPGIATHPGKGPSNRGRFVQRPGGFSLPASNVPATEALATGTAFNPNVAIVVNPSAPVGTGTAYDASISIVVGATASLGAGSVSAATANVGPAALAAAATANANQALIALRVNPNTATGTGTANNVASGFNAFVNAQPALGFALPNGLWTARPKVSPTSRPGSGTTSRPFTGITIDPG